LELGKHVDAYKTFALVVRETTEHSDAKYDQTREAAAGQLTVLDARVAKLVISLPDIPPGLVVTVDGAAIPERDLGAPVVLESGNHRIDAKATGVAPVRRELNLDGGEVKTITMSFKESDEGRSGAAPSGASRSGGPTTAERVTTPTRSSAMRTVGYVAAGVGVTAVAVFAVTALMTKNTFQQLHDECLGGCSDGYHLSQIDRGKSLQTAANVSLIIGAVGLGTGATLIVLGAPKNESSGASASFYPHGASISYAGSF
jgi:hypothetical protein